MATAAVSSAFRACGEERKFFVGNKMLTVLVAKNPPLFLHVTSTSKEGLDKAIVKIDEMMKQDLPQLVDERRFRRREQEPVERDEYGRVRMLRLFRVFQTSNQ